MKTARREKSTDFWPWIGQTAFAQAAASMLDRDQWPATMLLAGPEHLGKASAAVWIAQRDLCQHPTAAPCGTCPDCRALMAGSHPDRLVVAVADQTITREQLVEEFQRLHWKSATASGRRWVILTDVDQLTEGIGNTLLKIIEEPPANTVVLMTSSFPQRILPTIRSRAIEYQWHRVPHQALDEYLASSFSTLNPALRRLISRQANGRPGLAITLARHPEVLTEQWATAQLMMRGITSGRWPQRRDWSVDDLDQAERLIRDALVVAHGASPRTWVNESAALIALGTTLGTERLQRLAVRLRDRGQLLRQHVQPSFILHDLSF